MSDGRGLQTSKGTNPEGDTRIRDVPFMPITFCCLPSFSSKHHVCLLSDHYPPPSPVMEQEASTVGSWCFIQRSGWLMKLVTTSTKVEIDIHAGKDPGWGLVLFGTAEHVRLRPPSWSRSPGGSPEASSQEPGSLKILSLLIVKRSKIALFV